MYVYYQVEGGREQWKLARTTENLAEKLPTFVTVLQLDTILDEDVTQEKKDATKYQGPMYFDLDSDVLEDSIEDGKALLQKLKDLGLGPQDMRVYLSGKKGIHILIPMSVFAADKPLARLPEIYKEVAYKLAVPSVDFRVYTAGKGRMLRTCFRQRENGLYRVPVSLDEMESLTEEGYRELCSAQRPEQPLNPRPCNELGLLFDAAQQKVGGARRRKVKPASPTELRAVTPSIEALLGGHSQEGFNQIAVQLAVFARESAWAEDLLVSKAQGFLQNHQGGSRYSNPRIRERELRNMFRYINNNAGYEFSTGAVQRLLPRSEDTSVNPLDSPLTQDEVEYESLVFGAESIFAKGEDQMRVILNAGIQSPVALYALFSENHIGVREVLGVGCKLVTGYSTSRARLERGAFNSASTMHSAVSVYGLAFTGNDQHARTLYRKLMADLQRKGGGTYTTEREGLDYLKISESDNDTLRDGFLAWVDSDGIRSKEEIQNLGITLEYVPSSASASYRCDLTRVEPTSEWIEREGNKDALRSMFKSLFASNRPAVISKTFGWLTAAFSRQIFVHHYGAFPLLHVVGSAGLGKSETIGSYMRMFYYKADVNVVTPTSTIFAIQQAMHASASIPIVVDEYKPGEMNDDYHNKIKLLLRDSYNQRSIVRGGGNKGSGNYNAMSSHPLSAPVCFIAEAVESESALMERVVLVTLKRPGDALFRRYHVNFLAFKAKAPLLCQVGFKIAETVLERYDGERFKRFFDNLHQTAIRNYMLTDEDVASGDPTRIGMRSRVKPRTIYNTAVVEYGWMQFKHVVRQLVGDEFDEELEACSAAIYEGIYDTSEVVVPEYIKVLNHMGAIIHVDPEKGLMKNHDYALEAQGDARILCIVPDQTFFKYRSWCRSQGTKPLFTSEQSFIVALRNSPAFIEYTMDPDGVLSKPSIILRISDLISQGYASY